MKPDCKGCPHWGGCHFYGADCHYDDEPEQFHPEAGA